MRAAANVGFICLFALLAAGCAQTSAPAPAPLSARNQTAARTPPDPDPPQEHAPRRLESLTWNSVKHELTWVVIDMDSAIMRVRGETRGFSREEAANVHVLVDAIAKYAVDSTLWWDDGQGERLDENGAPKTKPKPREKTSPSENEGLAVLHVRNPAAPLSHAEMGSRIRKRELRLATLKRLDRRLPAERLELRRY